MAMPHANDSSGSTTWRPNEYDQFRIEPAHRSESGLSVVKAIVDPREVIPGEDLFGPAHIESPLLQRALPLGGIASDAHDLL
jgi:hypothetical protein